MTFTHRRNPISYSYIINGTTVSLLDKSVTDFGFVFTPTMNPRLHVEANCYKALKTLGFIKRISSEFGFTSPLKVLSARTIRQRSAVFCPRTYST